MLHFLPFAVKMGLPLIERIFCGQCLRQVTEGQKGRVAHIFSLAFPRQSGSRILNLKGQGPESPRVKYASEGFLNGVTLPSIFRAESLTVFPLPAQSPFFPASGRLNSRISLHPPASHATHIPLLRLPHALRANRGDRGFLVQRPQLATLGCPFSQEFHPAALCSCCMQAQGQSTRAKFKVKLILDRAPSD